MALMLPTTLRMKRRKNRTFLFYEIADRLRRRKGRHQTLSELYRFNGESLYYAQQIFDFVDKSTNCNVFWAPSNIYVRLLAFAVITSYVRQQYNVNYYLQKDVDTAKSINRVNIVVNVCNFRQHHSLVLCSRVFTPG